jgi:hypothetical protein
LYYRKNTHILNAACERPSFSEVLKHILQKRFTQKEEDNRRGHSLPYPEPAPLTPVFYPHHRYILYFADQLPELPGKVRPFSLICTMEIGLKTIVSRVRPCRCAVLINENLEDWQDRALSIIDWQSTFWGGSDTVIIPND